MEGAILGAAVGGGLWLAGRIAQPQRGALLAALVGAAAGVAIVLLGGRLMLGSLESLGDAFPGSQLRLDALGFIPSVHIVTAAIEAGLFCGCVVAAMKIARRHR
jgi:hypothetical protein